MLTRTALKSQYTTDEDVMHRIREAVQRKVPWYPEPTTAMQMA